MILDSTSIAALADARRNACAALAALKALSFQPSARDDLQNVSRVASSLSDAIAELERLEHAARLQP